MVKPDQLFGKRGKHGLVLAGAGLDKVAAWIGERMNRDAAVGAVTGKLTHFLVEPFTPHDTEYYVAIKGERDGDVIYFSARAASTSSRCGTA